MTARANRFVTVGSRGYRARTIKLGPWRPVATAFATGFFVVATLAPMLALVFVSFSPFFRAISWGAISELTTSNYADIFRSDTALTAALNTLVVALVSASAVALLATLISWVVVRLRAPGRGLLDILAFLPLGIPHLLIGVALIYVYLSFNFIPIYGTIWILVVAYVTSYLAFGSRVTSGAMLQIHSDLEEVGRTSGAGGFGIFRRITLPLLWPALMVVWLWVAIHAMRELSAAVMLQGGNNPVFTTLLWNYWKDDPPGAAAAGVLLLGGVFVFLIAWWRLSKRYRMSG